MSRSLVLACGNPERGDDGVALVIVELLKRSERPSETEVLSQQQWMPELAEPISKSEIVIFVDAADGIPPGTITSRDLQPAPHNPRSMTHHTSPESLLWLANSLYGKCPVRAHLLTVGGVSFELGEQLSEPVRRAIPHAVEHIRALLSGKMSPEN